MIYWELFWANFIANILGYGGGPATLPLLQKEVVNNYGWYTQTEFSEIVAIGNGLPGPIATKLAAYIGYSEAGVLGALVSLLGAVGPTLILMIVLMSILMRFKETEQVKRLTSIIRPTIGLLLAMMTYTFIKSAYIEMGIIHIIVLVICGYLFLEIKKVNPAYVVCGALIYGALFLG